MNSKTSTELRQLLQGWLQRVSENQKAHRQTAARNTKLHYAIGIPTIILSGIIGTSIFATLEKQTSEPLKIALGIMSILAAIMAGLQTFLRFAERASKHNETSSKLGDIRRDIEQLLAHPPKKLEDYNKRVSDIKQRLSSVEAPVLPERFSVMDMFID